MHKTRRSKFSMLLFLVAIVAISVLNVSLDKLPTEIKMIEGKEQKLEIKVPMTLQLFSEGPLYVNGNSINQHLKINLKEPLVLKSFNMGTYNLEFRLMGLIPVKKMKVQVLPETRLVPGGHSLGVKLRPEGVIVVGFASIIDDKGIRHQPAQEAGIQVGDTILKVEDKNIFQAEQLSNIVNNKRSIALTVKRKDKILTIDIKPVKSSTGIYQIGLWVRDIAAGVGTLTFYDPNTGLYGALGHIISDADTGKIIEVGNGEIIRARVASISPGRKNQPGEKRGVFINEEQIIGNIISNTPFGIFGKSYYPFENPLYSTLPVATINQVQEGKATILTVVEGEKIEEYDIEIQKITQQSYPNGKGMIIKIVDQELIKRTGGIVQGMSGSPIIQNGYIVGAVTHVFVNDPTKGYGIFLEWMLQEINKISSNEEV